MLRAGSRAAEEAAGDELAPGLLRCQGCGQLVEPGGCRALDWAASGRPRGKCWGGGPPQASDWCIYCGELLDEFGRCHRRELPPHPDEEGLTRR